MNTYILILRIQIFSFRFLLIFNFFILLTRPYFFCLIISLIIRSTFIILFRM
jgi:hypothetical protein